MSNLKFLTRPRFRSTAILTAVQWLLAIGSIQATAPNIVLVLIDDQGWTGTSVQMHPDLPHAKSDFYQTPRLEQLAAEGMRFYNGYSSQSVCSPTRAAILTGRSPAQLQMTDLPISYPGNDRYSGHMNRQPLTPPATEPLQPDVFTLPQIIKQSNPDYVTAHFGKWHLDATTKIFPKQVGYDYDALHGEDVPLGENPKAIFSFANSAIAFMEQNVANNRPFFVQLSQHAVHEPIESRQVIRDKYAALPPGERHDNIEFAAMTEDLDTSLGKMLDKIDQLGISDNTYVIYVSDNGSPVYISGNSPLNRGKAELREGGIRVPFIVRGPGVAPGSFSGVPVTTTDLFSTIARLTGFSGDLPSDVEGADFSPVLHNGGSLPDDMEHLSRNFHSGGELYWHWPHNYAPTKNYRVKPSSAIRDGDYKLFVEYGEHGGPDVVYLHNLVTDISEKINLAAAMPEKTAELRAKLDNYLTAIDASFPYDVKAPLAMEWTGDHKGNVPDGWRSTTEMNYKGKETWKLGGGTADPQWQQTERFQPGLPTHTFHFDGNDLMQRTFFHVGDIGPRRITPNVGTPDFDRSASLEFWIRFDSLTSNQILFESGTGAEGISMTVGDADLDGAKNDLRFRILGTTGTESGGTGVAKELTIDARIDRFADPTADFVHLAAVYSDDPTNRYAEVYVNGALAGRIEGLLGEGESLRWDNYDLAGLGNTGGNGLGGNGGSGPLPFSGGLRAEIGLMRLYNFAITPSEIQQKYNSVLHRAGHRVVDVTGDVVVPSALPTNVGLNQFESEDVQVMHERSSILSSSLPVDAGISVGVTLDDNSLPAADILAAGMRISSHLFQYDPLGSSPGIGATVQGAVNFSGRIVGIIWDSDSLLSTDSILGSIGNLGTYSRGIEFSAGDSLTISADLKTLNFNLTATTDEFLQFRVLTAISEADFNFDGYVDDADLAIWQGSFGVDMGGDADGDGDTDGRDFLVWQREYQPSGIAGPVDAGMLLSEWQNSYGIDANGDFDGDGDTDGRDFLVWQREYQSSGIDNSGDAEMLLSQWQQSYGISADGDFDGDGDTDGRDFLVWQRDFDGQFNSFAAVPEPASIVVIALLAAIVGLRREVA